MQQKRKLPAREEVFIASLLYHGFRLISRRKNLKKSKGYVIPATEREDSGGIDFWVKMPRDNRLFPVQVTQRGVRLYRKYRKQDGSKLDEFVVDSERRVQAKRKMCYINGIAFALVRDYDGKPSPCIAWGDIKALRYAIAHLKHRL